MFDTHHYERDAFEAANEQVGHTLTFEGELPEDLKGEWRSMP